MNVIFYFEGVYEKCLHNKKKTWEKSFPQHFLRSTKENITEILNAVALLAKFQEFLGSSWGPQ